MPGALHLIRALIRFPATLLPIPFPANKPGKTAEYGHMVPCPHKGDPDAALSFILAQPWPSAGVNQRM